ncbi:MAG: alpha/beta hydrolase [Pseudomonadota bacterium]
MKKKSLVSCVAAALALAGCSRATVEDQAFLSAPDVGGESLASATEELSIPTLRWADCGAGFECATARLPLDYAKPRGTKLSVAVTRLPARNRHRRIGSLFVNFGGPGGDAVASLQAFGADLFATLNERFDIVGFDPRGTGQTEFAIDCGVNQEKLGLYRKPFTTPENADPDKLLSDAQEYVDACVSKNSQILGYASTASAARDMDALRAAVGDAKLSYLGFSYGTFLGATYASLFPGKYRALVLDGALDAQVYINHPTDSLLAQNAGFERALERFFQACAADQTACAGFGGSDPHAAFDSLVASANVTPLPDLGDVPRAVTGEDIIGGSFVALYTKWNWPFLAAALAAAGQGDGTLMRYLADAFYGRLSDGTYDPLSDRYFTLGAAEQVYTADLDVFLHTGAVSWSEFDHFWWNAGYYAELPLGLFPIQARGAFYGPFRASPRSPTVLVVGTTYDPATPYRGSKRLISELGNARLLTMEGDGHTAYGGNSKCIDSAVESYFERGTLPKPGTVCQQEVPFAQPDAASRSSKLAGTLRAPGVAIPILTRSWVGPRR